MSVALIKDMDSGKKKMNAVWAHDSMCQRKFWCHEERTGVETDLEIMHVKEIVWAIGIEAVGKGEGKKRGLEVSQHSGREMVSRTQRKN